MDTETNMNNSNQEAIDNYLLGRTSRQEEIEFESKIDTDQSCLEQYVFTKYLKEELTAVNDMKAQMDLWENETKMENQNRWVRNYMKWIINSGIAAILILVITFINPSNNNIERYDLDSLCNPIMAEYGDYPDLNTIKNNVLDHKFDMALDKIDKYILQKEYVSEGKQNNVFADTLLNIDLGETKNQKNDYLQWLKALCIIGKGQEKEALSILYELSNNSILYKEKADYLINKIEERER